jgi:hypothetical protein
VERSAPQGQQEEAAALLDPSRFPLSKTQFLAINSEKLGKQRQKWPLMFTLRLIGL